MIEQDKVFLIIECKILLAEHKHVLQREFDDELVLGTFMGSSQLVRKSK